MKHFEKVCYAHEMKERKPQRAGGNSVSSHIKAIGNATRVAALPDGLTLDSDEEMSIWTAFSRARGVDDWRQMDLILLYKVVKAESTIRKYQAIVDVEGVVVKNDRGTPIVNPLVSFLDTKLRQQLAIIRSMSLNSMSVDPVVVRNTAKQEEKARKTLTEQGVESLLATPN